MDFGIISLGNHATSRVIPAMIKSGNRISAIYSTNKQKGETFSKELGADYFIDIDKMLSSDFEAAYISSPNNMHYTYSKKSLENGKDVLLEKPMTLSIEDSLDLVKLSKKTGKRLKLGFHLRFHPGIVKAKELTNLGKIGDLVQVSGSWNSFSSHAGAKTWWDIPEQVGGGAIVGRGVHIMDTIVNIVGRDVDSVIAINSPRCAVIEDTFSILISFKSGVFAHALTSRRTTSSSNDLLIFGSSGVIKVTNAFDTRVNSKLFIENKEIGSFSNYDMYQGEIEDFVASGQIIAGAEDGLLSTKMHLLSQKSSCQGEEIKI